VKDHSRRAFDFARRSRGLGRARGSKLLAALGAAAAVSVCTSAPALASGPVTYFYQAHCTTSVVPVGTSTWQQQLEGQIPTQTYSWLLAYRPNAVTHYTGTTSVVWRGQLEYLTTAGNYAPINQVVTNSVSSWYFQGLQIITTLWNPSSNPTFSTVPGYRYAVLGTTYWLNSNGAVIASHQDLEYSDDYCPTPS
jgi:hypothetical protein